MKKQFLKKILALFLCGFVLTHVSCGYDDDINELQERVDVIEGKKLTSVDEQMQSMQASISSLESAKKSLETAIESLEGEAAAINEELAALKQAGESNSQDIEALEEALQKKAASIEEQIAGLNAKTNSLDEQIKQINETLKTMATVDWVTATIEALKTQYATAEALSEVNTLVETLQTSITGLSLDLDKVNEMASENSEKIAKLQEEIAALQTELNGLQTTIEEAQEDVKEWVSEELSGYYTKGEIDGKIAAIEEVLETLSGTLENSAAIETLKAELAQEIADRKEALEAVETRLTEAYTKAVEAAVEAQGAINEQMQKEIDELKKVNEILENHATAVAEVVGRVEALEANMAEVLNRIQSIVYVPENNEHKAKVVSLYYGETMICEGQLVMTFRVTPIEAAAQLVAAYNEDQTILSLEPEQVTRSEASLFTIDKVVLEEQKADGRFVVYATPNGLAEEFYTEESSYSIALRLKKSYKGEGEEAEYTGNMLSNYVNIVPTKELVEVVLIAEVEDENGEVVEDILTTEMTAAYEIEYDDTDREITLLEGYELHYLLKGEYYTYAEMAEMGYYLPEVTTAAEHTAYSEAAKQNYADLSESNFEVNDGEEGICDERVKLKSPDKKFMKDVLSTTHAYAISDEVTVDFFTTVKITRPTRTVSLQTIEYIWWYEDFKAAMEDTTVQTPIYEGGVREFTLNVVESKLPADVKPEDVVKYWGDELVIEAENEAGEAVEGITVELVAYKKGAEEGADQYTIAFGGWEFDQNYTVKATSSYKNLDVRFEFEAVMTDLQEMSYDLGDITLTFDASKEVLVSENIEELAAKLFEEFALENHFNSADELAKSLAYENSVARATYSAIRDCDQKELIGEQYNNYPITTNPMTLMNYCCNWVANDGKMSANVMITRKHILHEDDQFNLTTEIMPWYEKAIVVTGIAKIDMPKYAVKHDRYTVAYDTDNGYYYSQVKGLWDPSMDSNALTGFSTDNVNLNDTFQIGMIVDGEWKALDEATIAEQQMQIEYTTDYTDEAEIKIDNNLLKYYGKAESIPVKGVLTVAGIEIAGAFTTVDDYSTFRVKKYDPINEWFVTETESIPTTSAKESYTVSIYKNLYLTDKRGVELINQQATDTNEPWVKGDGNNGFANDKNAGTVFGLKPIEISYRITDKENIDVNYLNDRVEVDKLNGTVTFKNLNNLALQEDILVRVSVKVSYPWGEKEGEIIYTIQK